MIIVNPNPFELAMPAAPRVRPRQPLSTAEKVVGVAVMVTMPLLPIVVAPMCAGVVWLEACCGRTRSQEKLDWHRQWIDKLIDAVKKKLDRPVREVVNQVVEEFVSDRGLQAQDSEVLKLKGRLAQQTISPDGQRYEACRTRIYQANPIRAAICADWEKFLHANQATIAAVHLTRRGIGNKAYESNLTTFYPRDRGIPRDLWCQEYEALQIARFLSYYTSATALQISDLLMTSPSTMDVPALQQPSLAEEMQQEPRVASL